MSDGKRLVRRRGRWTYDDRDGQYGNAGWHLDDSPIVIDFMPGTHGCCQRGPRCCRGTYLLYGLPGREHEPLYTHVDYAMQVAEEIWDEMAAAVVAQATEAAANAAEQP